MDNTIAYILIAIGLQIYLNAMSQINELVQNGFEKIEKVFHCIQLQRDFQQTIDRKLRFNDYQYEHIMTILYQFWSDFDELDIPCSRRVARRLNQLILSLESDFQQLPEEFATVVLRRELQELLE